MDNIFEVDVVRGVQREVIKSIKADIESYIVWGKAGGKDELEIMSELCFEIKRILRDVQWGGVEREADNT